MLDEFQEFLIGMGQKRPAGALEEAKPQLPWSARRARWSPTRTVSYLSLSWFVQLGATITWHIYILHYLIFFSNVVAFCFKERLCCGKAKQLLECTKILQRASISHNSWYLAVWRRQLTRKQQRRWGSGAYFPPEDIKVRVFSILRNQILHLSLCVLVNFVIWINHS